MAMVACVGAREVVATAVAMASLTAGSTRPREQ